MRPGRVRGTAVRANIEVDIELSHECAQRADKRSLPDFLAPTVWEDGYWTSGEARPKIVLPMEGDNGVMKHVMRIQAKRGS